MLVEPRTKNASRIGYASGGTVGFARTSLGLCRPAPTRDRKQEKQRGAVEETHVGNVGATRNTKGGRKHLECCEHPQDQRENCADQA
jgi:hypothetical protein